jgi:sarcosine oxidase subunit delta
MRIPCPFCGFRDIQEFVSRGEAAVAANPADFAETFDALYTRKNVIGPAREYFYHAQGCRSWLIVERDVRTHEVLSAALANPEARS